MQEEHIRKFMTIIQTAEMALFAGKDNAAAMQETYDDTMDVLANIESSLN